jgi:hypothetical protein
MAHTGTGWGGTSKIAKSCCAPSVQHCRISEHYLKPIAEIAVAQPPLFVPTDNYFSPIFRIPKLLENRGAAILG